MTHTVITGTGRCGTQYVTQALNAAGIPCSHERVYTPAGFEGWGDFIAESSLFAVRELPLPCTTIHLIRDPLGVITSLASEKIRAIARLWYELPDSPMRQWAESAWDLDFAKLSRIEAAIEVYVRMNAAIETHTQLRFRIEELHLHLGAFTRLCGADYIRDAEKIPRFYRSMHRGPDLTWEQVPAHQEIRAMALRYGYV